MGVAQAHEWAQQNGPNGERLSIRSGNRRHGTALKRKPGQLAPASLDTVQRALSHRTRWHNEFVREIQRLEGNQRLQAIQACLSAGMTRAEVARVLEVSKQRVTQLLQESERCPF